jgi:hypothetical protein
MAIPKGDSSSEKIRLGGSVDPVSPYDPSGAEDPFFKDPAKVIGHEVAQSLSAPSHASPKSSGEHEVIHDGFTAEAPNPVEPAVYDATSYGAQAKKVLSGPPSREGVNASDLDAIYARRQRAEPLTINEGPPRRVFSVWDIPGFGLLIKLVVLALIVMVLFMIQINIVDEDGVDSSLPLPVWIYTQATMSTEQQMMQSLDPSERQFILTTHRIKRIAAAASHYELTSGKPPLSVFNLLDERLVLPSRINDGWGNNFRIEVLNDVIVVRSAGKDRAFQTDDDITFMGDATITYSELHYGHQDSLDRNTRLGY